MVNSNIEFPWGGIRVSHVRVDGHLLVTELPSSERLFSLIVLTFWTEKLSASHRTSHFLLLLHSK